MAGRVFPLLPGLPSATRDTHIVHPPRLYFQNLTTLDLEIGIKRDSLYDVSSICSRDCKDFESSRFNPLDLENSLIQLINDLNIFS